MPTPGIAGAGKTTLLNCLTGKLRKGVSGHINLKGANGKHLKMCTIPQKDHLLELLTVEENLWFASKIKNPEYGFDHAKNIERVIAPSNLLTSLPFSLEPGQILTHTTSV